MISSSGAYRCRQWCVLAAVAVSVLEGGRTAAQQVSDEEMIEEGRRLFVEETFDGNGRTCATCHPASNNFTIDPAYVRRLPGNDPLFVTGPSLPDLKALEVRRMLLRGLILENVDGLDQPGVLRGVPHTLGLRQSLKPDAALVQAGITHATGWSGDGAPDSGSLRDFAKGAVIQHFPKSVNRVPGIDFRLPTAHELAALEAFQLSLGRQEEIDLAALTFSDPIVAEGKALFERAPSRNGSGRGCGACHANAGANGGNGVNRNRATGTNLLPNVPGCLAGFVAPGDGGFGREPVQTAARDDVCGKSPGAGPKATMEFRGDLTLNTPSLIEAADTAPLFHNNTAATVEDAVRFYTTEVFNDSLAGAGNAFVLTEQQVRQIAALLRAINVLENIRSSNAYHQKALQPQPVRARESVELAIAETGDAIEVLTGGPVELFAATNALALLLRAQDLGRQALDQGLPAALLQDAIALQEEAHDLMVQ